MLNLFKSQQIDIKSDLSLEAISEKLKDVSTFNNNDFRINHSTLSLFRGTKVNGQVGFVNNKTIVRMKISPSSDFKAGTFILFLAYLTFPIMFVVYLSSAQNIGIQLIIAGCLAIFAGGFVLILILRLFLKYAVWIRTESLKGLIGN